MNMEVLFDTNVIIDAITERTEEYKYSQKLIGCILNNEIHGYISSKQVTDIYYILRKYFGDKERRSILSTILDTFTVLPLLSSFTTYCLKSEMIDYEDAVLDETASVNVIPYIVTSNTRDFEKSKTAILTPKGLYSLVMATSKK